MAELSEARCGLCGAAHTSVRIAHRCAAGQEFARDCAGLAAEATERTPSQPVHALHVRELAGNLRTCLTLTDRGAVRVARLVLDLGWRPKGIVTFRDILACEVAEAFAEEDPARLRAELIQVAAVAVQWVEAIDARAVTRD